jgi:hypothetical protein
VLALSSVGRAAYRLGETDLEGRLAAFKEAGELEYTAYTALLLYDLPEPVQASLSLSPGLLGHFRPMALDLCKNREGRSVGWQLNGRHSGGRGVTRSCS